VRILSRHFLASYLRLFAAVLSLSLLAIVVVEMLVNFDEIVEHRKITGGPLGYLLLRVPALYLRELVPVASFAASFLCFALPASRREITAVKTGGVDPGRLALPVLGAAALLSALSLAMNETFLLGATRQFNRLEYPDESVAFGRDSFWYHRGNTFYHVARSDDDSQDLQAVRIFELDPRGRLLTSLAADRVTVDADERWHIRDAVRRRFDPDLPAAPPVTEPVASAVLDMGGHADLALLEASENTLSLPQLLGAIELRSRQQRDASRYRAMLHARLAVPASVLLFALLAVPVGLSVERSRNLALSALAGIALVGAFHAAWHVATLVSRSGFAPAAPLTWGVLGLFAAGALGYLLARSPR
jgi:lipopolysaccharide export system permease protein